MLTLVYRFTIYDYFVATEKTTYIVTKQRTDQHIKSLHNRLVNKNGKSISYESNKRQQKVCYCEQNVL